MLISLDTETTGIDRYHGAKPFFVTTCTEEGLIRFWEWDVDPLTRQPCIPEEDIDEIAELLSPNCCSGVVLHNAKFDVAMLATIRPEFGEYWRWDDTWDTLLENHLLYSNRPKDLTSLGTSILGINIKPKEDALEEAVKEARAIAKKKYPTWRLAAKDDSDMPSAKEKTWRFDYWVPRAVAKAEDYPDDHPWWTVLAEYSNADSEVTIALHGVCMGMIKERGLEKILKERLRIMEVVYNMEQQSKEEVFTLSKDRYDTLKEEYQEESARAEAVCVNIAKGLGYELELPKGGTNHSLVGFCFGSATITCPACKAEQSATYAAGLEFKTRMVNKMKCTKCGALEHPQLELKKNLGLPIAQYTETGQPSISVKAIDQYLAPTSEYFLPEKSKQRLFVEKLLAKRKRDTALTYMASYARFWLPCSGLPLEEQEKWFVLHPSLNMTGTDTLRFSSSNPNEQNISKKEGFNLRWMFGPKPGREWWSMDARGIEDRLPAYESKQQELIDIFERPDESPYYGSNHFLRFHTVYPDIWDAAVKEVGIDKAGPFCKKKYASTYYQWVKNGGFAVQYGAIDRADGKGTADIAFHRAGSHKLLRERFSKLETLNQYWIRFANKYGYVETIPDKTVDPTKGYPLLCTRTEWGKILPTVPLNYHIQGSAMWWMSKAMVRVYAQLQEWAAKGFHVYIVMQVHDELVFDFPKKSHPKENPKESNLGRIRVLQKLMEEGGNDFGIPTPTSCEYHPDNWSEGISL